MHNAQLAAWKQGDTRRLYVHHRSLKRTWPPRSSTHPHAWGHIQNAFLSRRSRCTAKLLVGTKSRKKSRPPLKPPLEYCFPFKFNYVFISDTLWYGSEFPLNDFFFVGFAQNRDRPRTEKSPLYFVTDLIIADTVFNLSSDCLSGRSRLLSNENFRFLGCVNSGESILLRANLALRGRGPTAVCYWNWDVSNMGFGPLLSYRWWSHLDARLAECDDIHPVRSVLM